MSRSGGPNFLGAQYAPFVVAENPDSPNFRVRDVALPRGLTDGRFRGRKDLRQARRSACRASPTRPPPTRSAPSTSTTSRATTSSLSQEAQQAFDIHREPDASSASATAATRFGQRALLARRLVEAGVPFVTLYDGGWDHHTRPLQRLQQAAARLGQHGRGADRRSGRARPARHDAGHRPRRVRPHAADQQRRRPRPLVERHERAVRRRRHARRPGDRRDRPQGLRRRRARPLARELRLDGLPQARHRSRQDVLHARRPAGASGQRSASRFGS